MGTSTSSRGANNRSPLVPPGADVDGDGLGPKPDEQRFRAFRTPLGKFVASGDEDQLRRTLRNYASFSTGGSTVGPRRFGAVAQSGAAMFGALNDLRTGSPTAPANLRAFAGRPTREVIDALVDAFVLENGDADRIRAALNDALSESLEGVEEFDFASITDEVLVSLMVSYVSLSVFQAIVLDSDRAFGRGATPADVENAEHQLMELVTMVCEKHIAPHFAGNVGGISPAQMQAAQIAAIREVWKEWEGYER